MMGTSYVKGGDEWPACGEIDIMEYRGQTPNVVHGTAHGPGYSKGDGITDRYTLPGGQGFDQDFHDFAIEWEPGRIAWFVDDQFYHAVSTGSVGGRGEWVFNQQFFFILNIAVGGVFVGGPDASTQFPQEMTIDHVRVYKRSPGV